MSTSSENVSKFSQRPKDPSGYVYYARLNTPQGVFYKIGYTTKKSLRERMSYGGTGDEKLIEREIFFTFRKNAWDIEQNILKYFDDQRAFGKFSNDSGLPLAGRGQSELFRSDILGADDELYKSFKESKSNSAGGCLMVIIGIALVPFTVGFSLLLLLIGFSEIFSNSKITEEAFNAKNSKPKHPKEIHNLIHSLKSS